MKTLRNRLPRLALLRTAVLAWSVLAGSVLAGSVLASPELAHAQVAMHREVPRGDVTGLEMGIEGSLVATPGAPVRWWITLYEVVRRRELRPAPGCSVRAMASHDRAEPIASITTDASGRAALVMPMTDALAESPHLVLDATCPRGVRRLFDVDLELDTREQLVLAFDRRSVVPGGSALAIGRVLDRATGRGVAGVDVDIQVQQGGPVGAPRRVRTDGAGMFATMVVAGELGQALGVTAWTVHDDGSSTSAAQSLVVATPPAPESLSVRVTTSPAIAAPGALVDVTVEVRDADGAPVEGALVSGPARDPAPEDSTEPLPEIRTDARGIAHHPWRLDRDLEAGALVETSTSVNVTSTALGSRSAGASVRVARRRTFLTLALEGGTLVPGAPTRVLARAVGPDGVALAGHTLTLTSAMLGSVDGAPLASAETDADGMAVFVVPRVGDVAVDDCGGTTAASVELAMDGETTSICVPVDPDAPLAIHASPRLAPGSALPVALSRTPRSSARPIVVTALRRGLRGWQPIAQEIAPAGASSVTLTPGELATGEIWVRARMVMPDGQVVRGASTLVSFSPAPGSISVEADRSGVRVQGADATDSVLVLAEGASPGMGGDETDLVSLLTGEVGREDATSSSSGLALEAELAIRVPLDLGASSILRGGEVVPQAMPEEPVTLGLLRDPWRTRARFVRGRLGRLFLAVEDMVERRIPDRIGEVASAGPRGWTWNREMLAPAVAEAAIDDEGSASLDGEPLDIDALVALDPSFTFDHVARRLTRKRLFRVIRAIRQVTHERNLDLPWARRGDPRTWIASLVGVSLGDGSTLDTNDLFDAWGHAFVFRPTTRRAFLPAVEGWEVASLGPDGRDGTGDDLFDPFARVVPSGTLYADAVGEDALVARLTGVALGRSWITVLDEELVTDDRLLYLDEHPSQGLLADAWAAAPVPLREVPALGRRLPITTQPGAHLGEGRALRWTLPAERRSYAAIAIAVPRDGRPRLASRTFAAGASITLRATLPDVLRVGDRVSVPVSASELEGGAAPRLSLVPTGTGARATLASVSSSETGTTSGRVVLEASEPGANRARAHGLARVGRAHGRASPRARPPGRRPRRDAHERLARAWRGAVPPPRRGRSRPRPSDHPLGRDTPRPRSCAVLHGPRDRARRVVGRRARVGAFARGRSRSCPRCACRPREGARGARGCVRARGALEHRGSRIVDRRAAKRARRPHDRGPARARGDARRPLGDRVRRRRALVRSDRGARGEPPRRWLAGARDRAIEPVRDGAGRGGPAPREPRGWARARALSLGARGRGPKRSRRACGPGRCFACGRRLDRHARARARGAAARRGSGRG